MPSGIILHRLAPVSQAGYYTREGPSDRCSSGRRIGPQSGVPGICYRNSSYSPIEISCNSYAGGHTVAGTGVDLMTAVFTGRRITRCRRLYHCI